MTRCHSFEAARSASDNRAMASSVPGKTASMNPVMSSRSRYVPRSMTSTKVSRHFAKKASRSTAASSCWAKKPCIGVGRGPTGSPSAGPNARAGSVESSSTRSECAAARASAIAIVVLPTPPLPPTITQGGSSLRRLETLTPLADVTQLLHEHSLDLRVLDFVDLAQFQTKLQLHEIGLDLRVVRQLSLGHVLHLTERPPDPRDVAGDWKENELRENSHLS